MAIHGLSRRRTKVPLPPCSSHHVTDCSLCPLGRLPLYPPPCPSLDSPHPSAHEQARRHGFGASIKRCSSARFVFKFFFPFCATFPATQRLKFTCSLPLLVEFTCAQFVRARSLWPKIMPAISHSDIEGCFLLLFLETKHRRLVR
jgi:hypothetical protein